MSKISYKIKHIDICYILSIILVMNTPELSIIIPVYNGQDYIVRCVDSIMRQKDSDKYEIIIIDDGSNDDTPKILDAAANLYKNVRVIHQKNSGVSVARNNGIAASHGKYLTFVDADDMVGLKESAFDKYFISPSGVSTIGNMNITTANNVLPLITNAHFDNGYFVNMLRAAKDTNAEVVLGGKITVNRNEIYMRRHVYENDFLYDIAPDHKDILLRQTDRRENANFALYNRKMLDKHNLRFMANMKLDEDMLFCMLAVLYAEHVATVKDVTYFYNRHENTLSNIVDYNEKMEKQKIADIRRFSYLLNKLGQMPQYSKSFTYWTKEYSKKGTKYIHDTGDFPSKDCYYICGESECTGCFIADAMREQFKTNIEKYLGITR